MLTIDTTLRLDLALKVSQLQMTAARFGIDHIKDMIRDGVADQGLRSLHFRLVRKESERVRHIHGKFIIDIDYDGDDGPEYTVRWQPESSADLEPGTARLCSDFNAVITQLRRLAAEAPDCRWESAIVSSPDSAGDGLCRKYGYTKDKSVEYVDRTKPVGHPVENTACSGVTAQTHASDALMDGELK